MTPPPLPSTPSDTTGDPRGDAELFETVAGDDGAASRAAQEVLYRRHVHYLYGALAKQRDKLLRVAGISVDDLLQDTFQRSFERAGSFAGDPGLDPDRSRRRTRAWLGRIAHNLLVDSFRRYREVSASDYLDGIEAPAEGEGPPSSRPELRPIRAAMALLTDREQDILRVSALYFKAEGRGRLPNAVSAELGRRWGIGNDNVRAIRSRAFKKLRAALADKRSTTAEEKS